MASSSATLKVQWGKASKAFAEYLNIAGQTIGKKSAENLAAAGAEFMANEDWDWPRGARYDAVYNGRNVRASGTYASGFRGGDAMHPWYSGNLHDSMAMGVMLGTRIMAERYMNPGASEPQTYNGQTIDGVTAGHEALSHAAHTFAAGQSGDTLRVVLVIGAPYAEKVNTADSIGWPGREKPNTHQGYVEYLEGVFASTMRPSIEKLRNIKLKLK